MTRARVIFAAVATVIALAASAAVVDIVARESGSVSTPEVLSTAASLVADVQPSPIPTETMPTIVGALEPNPAISEPTHDAELTPTSSSQPVESTPAVTPTPMPPSEQGPTVERPVRMRIPALGIDAGVQWVGLDDQGRMETPSNYVDTAWYERGPIPGAPGNAVIAGHLDSTSGPAVFYRLGELRPEDDIIVVTSDGQELRFIVAGSEAYNVNDAPLDRIFGPADEPRLNLITCSGSFDRSVGEYDERLVVYATLASD